MTGRADCWSLWKGGKIDCSRPMDEEGAGDGAQPPLGAHHNGAVAGAGKPKVVGGEKQSPPVTIWTSRLDNVARRADIALKRLNRVCRFCQGPGHKVIDSFALKSEEAL